MVADEKAVFFAALALSDAKEREAYLQEACAGRPELLDRLRALLSAHEESHGPLDRLPAAPSVSADTQVEANADEATLGFLAPSDKPDAIGRLGHYEILEVIGRGGMGIVLRAFDDKLHRIVAIKVMAAQLATNGTARKRFTREAQAQAAVSHDHIVAIHAVEETDGLPYLVMQYVTGMSLQERLDRGGPLQLHEILRIGMQTASGLVAAHAQGLIHRDIKPSNILLENSVERVKITDFGLARAATEASLTQSGVVAGTPQYMSPEQAEGKAIDQRTDLFSLGSVLYAMCTGRPPFRATTTVAVLKRVCEETPRPIRETNPEIPDWLVAIIAKLHAKDPAERYQSAAEVAELLSRHLAHVQHPSVAPLPSVGRLENAVAEERRSRARRRCALAALILILLVGALSLAEASGFTNLRATLGRIFTPDGTLVVEVAQAGVEVTIEADDGTVFSGAGRQEVHLPPGPYKVRATKDGKTVHEEELVTITSGETQVVRVSRVAERVLAVPETQAFVVLSGKGFERKFDTLADAVAGASAGDTIEVRGNGPFLTDPIVRTLPLILRAGPGFRPVIRLTRDGILADKPLLWTRSDLVLEGVVLERIAPLQTKEPTPWNTILDSSGNALLFVANCRFVNTSGSCFRVGGAGTLRNCEFLTPPVGKGYTCNWNSTAHGQGLIDNCIHSSSLAVFNPRRFGGATAKVRFSRNTTLAAVGAVFQEVNELPAVATLKDVEVPLQIDASSNVFGPSVLVFQQLSTSTWASSAKEAEALVPHVLQWNEKQNLYPKDAKFLAWMAPNWKPLPTRRGHDLADWNVWWGNKDAGSIQGAIHFQGGDLESKATVNPDQLTATDFRLRVDSAGYRAGKDGKDLGADIDLVGPGPAYERWKKTPEYQQWLKDTNQVGTPTPEPEPKAFVVLSGKGAQLGMFATLAEAVKDARDGDTIEIRGNGPFVTPAVSVLDKSLSIRAGEGFLPVIQLNEEGTKSGAPLFFAHGVRGSLSLEGLEIHGANYTRADGGVWWLIRCDDAALNVTNCRFLRPIGDKGRLIFIAIWRCPLFQVRNCQFVNPPRDAAIAWTPHEGGKGIVKNCLFAGDYAIELAYSYPSRGSLSLENNTLATDRNLIVRLYKGPPLGTPADKVKLLHLEARENILGGDINFWENPESIENKLPMSALQAENLLQRLILWKEARNLHGIAPGKPFLTLKGPNAAYKKTTRPYSTLAEWQDFWGLEALDSLQGLPVFQGGNLLARARQNPEKLLPEDFRLAPGSPGKGAGPGGKDLGADVDLVGPGKAYERWKKTPEYQQWLKDTNQVRTPTPEAEPKAFVVLSGKGVAERKFDTLADAVIGANPGETIEVRGNGPFVCKPIVIPRYQALTIRAAPGYRPVMRLSPDAVELYATLLSTSAPLTVEGLEFRIGDSKDPSQPSALLVSDSPLHVANCRFVRTRTSLMVSGHRSKEVEIRNCEFIAAQGERGCVYWLVPPPSGKFRLEHCVFVSKGMGLHLEPGVDSQQIPQGLHLRCDHNTFVTDDPFMIGIRKGPKESKAGSGGGPSLRLESMGNLFARARTAIHLNTAPWQDPKSPKNVPPPGAEDSLTAEWSEALLRQAVGWKGKANLYPRVPDLLRFTKHVNKIDWQVLQRPKKLETLADWKQFWGSEEEDSLQDNPRFQGGDVLSKALNNPYAISAQDFRLAEDSPGKRAGKDGKDLGADVDLVGPGPAYERWQKTPEYQQWLKDTRQVKAGGVVEPQSNLDADRKAAEWVLQVGGQVWVVFEASPKKYKQKIVTLPEQPFWVIDINLIYNQKVNDAGLENLKGLLHLRSLILTNIGITDVGLEHIKGSKNLDELFLTGTRVGDSGLEHLAGLTKLRILSLGGTKVSDKGLKHLKGLSKLGTLYLSGTPITDAGLKYLPANLWSLHLQDTVVTDEGLKSLKVLPITGLSLDGTAVTDAGLEHLQAMTKLVDLFLYGAAVADASLQRLQELKGLQSLHLDNTAVTDEGLKYLQGLKGLHSLSLWNTPISDTGLIRLQELKGLKSVSLLGTAVSEAGVGLLKKALPKCTIHLNNKDFKEPGDP